MSGCHPTNLNKRADCIACNGGLWGGIYPPLCICNGATISKEEFNKQYPNVGEPISPLSSKIQELEEKVIRLEDRYESFTKCQHPKLLQERIGKLEIFKEASCDQVGKTHDWIIEIEGQIERLSSTVQAILIDRNKKPHLCPLCKCFCKGGFSPDSICLNCHKRSIGCKCPACEGKGIVIC